MNIRVRNLSFGYGTSHGKLIFDKLSADFGGGEDGRPLVILGQSGCGKTTLLKLLGGLLLPQGGEVQYTGMNDEKPKIAFMFQESRLLPWLRVLENVSLPLEKDFGKDEARLRARHFLSLVSLADKEAAFPMELSGGQAQRVSMARAFAWNAPALFMDEPFQSLDISLRISLMDLCLYLMSSDCKSADLQSIDVSSTDVSSAEKRLLIAVTHDPREALYLGGRIIVLGKAGEGIVYDRVIDIPAGERIYGSSGALERELTRVLTSV